MVYVAISNMVYVASGTRYVLKVLNAASSCGETSSDNSIRCSQNVALRVFVIAIVCSSTLLVVRCSELLGEMMCN
jgi:hypothetical protein